jgi:hypothetical protein
MKAIVRPLLLLLAFLSGSISLLPAQSPSPAKSDADFDKIALNFISGYLAARPLQGVALGFHQYDGKIADYSRLAIDAEVERLQRFQDELSKLDPKPLSKVAEIDRRILLGRDRRRAFSNPGNGDLRQESHDLRPRPEC